MKTKTELSKGMKTDVVENDNLKVALSLEK
jgi:hypothetical protein